MVLEYVHGYNLGQWHRYVVDTRQRMPIDYAIYIVTRVLDALQYAHTFVRSDGTPMQIVHRDVSPGNILIDTQGHVKLLDFGIARADESDEYQTRDGMFKGKLSYSAPEIYEGVTATPRSDVYSAGIVLYQLLSGENPFRGKDMAEIVRRVLTQKPPPIAARREDIPPELDAVIERAIVKKPAERYPSAAAFADALRSAWPSREEDFVTDFIDDVWNDFNGEMPLKIGLEPLQTRDAAWREAHGDGQSPRGPLSSTPPANEEPAQQEHTILQGSAEDESSRSVTRSVWLSGGAVLLAGAAAAYAWIGARTPPTVSSRFVVVEKQSRDDPPMIAVASAAPPAAASEAAPSAAESAASAASAVHVADLPPRASAASPSSRGKPDAVALSRSVQRQRASIESCFREHVKEVDGRPEVSVRFRALNSTPLGQCLIRVARATDFGPQAEGISFVIPIVARRVN